MVAEGTVQSACPSPFFVLMRKSLLMGAQRQQNSGGDAVAETKNEKHGDSAAKNEDVEVAFAKFFDGGVPLAAAFGIFRLEAGVGALEQSRDALFVFCAVVRVLEFRIQVIRVFGTFSGVSVKYSIRFSRSA